MGNWRATGSLRRRSGRTESWATSGRSRCCRRRVAAGRTRSCRRRGGGPRCAPRPPEGPAANSPASGSLRRWSGRTVRGATAGRPRCCRVVVAAGRIRRGRPRAGGRRSAPRRRRRFAGPPPARKRRRHPPGRATPARRYGAVAAAAECHASPAPASGSAHAASSWRLPRPHADCGHGSPVSTGGARHGVYDWAPAPIPATHPTAPAVAAPRTRRNSAHRRSDRGCHRRTPAVS